MKRKPTLIILSLVAAFTLLAVTAFASPPEYEGYEAFKTLAKNHEGKGFEEEKNGRVKASLLIQENGQEVLDLDLYFKADGVSEKVSGGLSIDANGMAKDLDVFAEDDMAYIFDQTNNNYYQVNKDDGHNDMNDDYEYKHGSYGKDKELNKAQEELLDFVMGELKDDFELVNNSDGSETIRFELTKDEIPMLLNLLFSAMDHHKSDMPGHMDMIDDETLEKYPLLKDLSLMKVEMSKITDHMELDYLMFAVTTDANNEFQDLEFNLIVTGDDEQGVSHTQQMSGKFEVSEIGTTLVETPDLEGKELIIVDSKDFPTHEKNMHRGPKRRR